MQDARALHEDDEPVGVALAPDEQDELRIEVRRDGLAAVAARAGSSRTSLSSAIAGLPTRKGTIALLRNYLVRRVVER